MKRMCLRIAFVFVTIMASLSNAADQARPIDVAKALQEAYAHAASQVRPGVVCVTSYVRDAGTAPQQTAVDDHAWQQADHEDYPGFSRLATASGIVMSRDGIILTCRHQLITPDGGLADVVDIETPDTRHFVARVLGTEPTIDIAILKMEWFGDERPPDITPTTFGSLESIKPGHTVVAIGDPFGALQTVNTGVFSGFPNRDCYQADLLSTYIQVTMSVHSESLGGPLVNLDGQVIGMLVPGAIESGSVPRPSQGVAFALPIGTAIAVGEALQFKQTHESPWMGIAVLSLHGLRTKVRDPAAFGALKAPLSGLYIEDVFNPSPAAAADIRVGDFLTSIDGNRIATVADFQKSLYLSGIGRTVKLELLREGQVIQKTLTVELRPARANRP
jgi:S1-C subfamily serine protease